MNKLIKIISCLPSDKGNYHEMYYEDDGKPFKKNLFPPLDKIAIDNIGKQMAADFQKETGKDGKEHWNIKKLEPPSAMPAQAASGNGGGGYRSAETDHKIEKQVAMKIIDNRWDDLKAVENGLLNRRLIGWLIEVTSDVKPFVPAIKDKDGAGVFASEELKREVWDKLGDEEYNKWMATLSGDPTTEDCKVRLQAEKKAKK